MTPATDADIRASFVNASKREVAKATLPDLAAIDWERLDYLGWQDPKLPLTAYLVVEFDGALTGVLLHPAKEPAVRRRKLCVLCEDLTSTDHVSMYAASFAGAAGRRGDTTATFICTDFACSRNVRQPPPLDAGGVDEESRAFIIARRIDGLRERTARFVGQVTSRTGA